nr:uncharacterized protein LOC122322277 [Drosophila bipectinata]
MTGERVPTKREFLSVPIGFLSCYIVIAKLVIREIWRRGVNWDEPLPDNLAAAFEDWRQGMSKIEEFRFPRYYFGCGRVRMLLLLIFVDSSQSAFAAAAYWRATFENGVVRAHFISSKTKCAPIRTIYKQFVGNRVVEILKSTEASQWRWIPSAENVADDATRPRKAVDLSIGSRWLSGPPFLRGPEESWPRSRRFSNYNRLVRSSVWVLRFMRRCRGPRYGGEDHGLTSMECAKAERAVVRQSQRKAFAEDSQGKAAKSSRLHGLSPYFDEDGALAEMIVQHHHERMCHQNTEATTGAIRQKFWITNLRRLLRRVVSKSNVCKLRRARATQPEIGPRPEDRLEANGWLIKLTGLDYFGPLFVTVGRRTEKTWVALCTCLTTRAIHLEMAHDLSTDSCIIAVRNFMSRLTVDQEAPLSPNDLQKGAPDGPHLPKDDGQESVRCATRKQWRIARMMQVRFWERWVHEYLPTLVRRERWCKHVEPIRQGDLVFICDPAIPRREW